MKKKNIEPALLQLLGLLPLRICHRPQDVKIVIGDESITVSLLVDAVLSLIREGIKGTEEDEL